MAEEEVDLLEERDLTIEERNVAADEPRHGVWIYDNGIKLVGDSRALSQDDTNAAIVLELQSCVTDPESRRYLRSIIGPTREPNIVIVHPDENEPRRVRSRRMLTQRGGIHEDELVRLLAFRAWGHRDREWFGAPALAAMRIQFGFDELGEYRIAERDTTTIRALGNGGLSARTFEDDIAPTPAERTQLIHDVVRTLAEELGLLKHRQ